MSKYKLPIRRKETHCDSDQRLRVYIDLDAKKIDACYVEMPATGMGEVPVYDCAQEGWTHERLWAEALRTAAWLRAQPYERVYPETVFIPYVELTLTDRDRAVARSGLLSAMITGCAFEDVQPWGGPARHEERVRALGQAWDYLTVLRIGSEQ